MTDEFIQQHLFSEGEAIVSARKQPSKRSQKAKPLDIASINFEFIQQLASVPLCDRSFLPKNKGIYFVLIRIPETKLIYVGSCKDINVRWQRHNQRDGLDYLQKVGVVPSIAYLEIEWSMEDIELLEFALIRKFKPALNITFSQKAVLCRGRELDDFTKKRIANSLPGKLEMLELFMLRAVAVEIGLPSSDSDGRELLIKSIKSALGDTLKTLSRESKSKAAIQQEAVVTFKQELPPFTERNQLKLWLSQKRSEI